MSPLDYDPSPSQDTYEKIRKFASNTEDESLRDVINKSVEIVEQCFTKYNPESVSVCFNGGKDCVAMLHIVHAVYQKLFPEKKLKSFYVSEKKTFSEVDEFIEKAIDMYGLVTKTYEEPMKTALSRMLEDDTEVEATMLGVRVGDPGDVKCHFISLLVNNLMSRLQICELLLPDRRRLASCDAGAPCAGLELPPGVGLHQRPESALPQPL